MRAESHRCLGRYLHRKYMHGVHGVHKAAFFIGCIEPDRNPASYLKGSFRFRLLRGHNYRNAKNFMRRISKRLERKNTWNVLDYYTLGKLIHYTADAFTSAHNDHFPAALGYHREYEKELQEHFLEYLRRDPKADLKTAGSVMEAISLYRVEYETADSGVHTDSRFAVAACCCVLTLLVKSPLY